MSRHFVTVCLKGFVTGSVREPNGRTVLFTGDKIFFLLGVTWTTKFRREGVFWNTFLRSELSPETYVPPKRSQLSTRLLGVVNYKKIKCHSLTSTKPVGLYYMLRWFTFRYVMLCYVTLCYFKLPCLLSDIISYRSVSYRVIYYIILYYIILYYIIYCFSKRKINQQLFFITWKWISVRLGVSN